MRDHSSWCRELVTELQAGGVLPDGRLTARDLAALELGLYFLHRHFEGEPIGALWPILSGYVVVEPGLQPVVRRLRHRMGDMGRRGYWRLSLDLYRRLPIEVRGFERTDDSAKKINDQTCFVPRPSSVCPERFGHYEAALTDPVPYTLEPPRPQAAPGEFYTFLRRDKVEERVRIPEDVEVLPPPLTLTPRRQRVREAWRISFDDDLAKVAERFDRALADKPEIANRNWVDRLGKIVFCAVDEDTGKLVEMPASFGIDGVEHMVGLMNSGKSTLADLITGDRVEKGFHVTLVVGSVTDVYAKVSFLQSVGIDTVPLVGKNSRTEHAARYWRSTLATSASVFPAAQDPAADFVNTICLLDPLRETNHPEWAPLTPDSFPCRGALRSTDGKDKLHDCPLLAVCPHQETERRIAHAKVWVTTAPGLVASRAEPAEAKMRWLEACQHHSDLIIIDEADNVQQDLDDRFVQYETLVAPGEGWTDRTTIGKVGGFDQVGRRQLRDRKVRRFNDYDRIHQHAIDKLYELVLNDEGLYEVIGKAPFTGFSLLLQVARIMHGLPLKRMDDNAAIEDAADDFFRQHLEILAEGVLPAVPDAIAPMVTALQADIPDEEAIDELISDWLMEHAPQGKHNHVRANNAMLAMLLQAGFWASRITTSFFEMSTLYPAVAESLPLDDEETFWRQQPPRDYQPLIPEAPMGNLLALQWLPNRLGDTGALRVMWIRGVGRWLLHHMHDLLEPEGIQGPHVILTSATSWAPGSSFYHVPIAPSAVLREPLEDREALARSKLWFRKSLRPDGRKAIAVSGRQGTERSDALRQLVSGICLPRPGAVVSLLEQVRADLAEDRKQVLFVVLSGAEAKLVAEHINLRTPYSARNVTPDADDPGQYGLHRRMITKFPESGDDILVAAEMAIQRGYNILNANRTAALGAVFYLARIHPPPTDPRFPLSLINQRAMAHLLDPAGSSMPLSSVAEAAKKLGNKARADWYNLMSRPVFFRRLDDRTERPAFVANALVPMGQTIGRSIRGHQPTHVILTDAAFAPRHADPDEQAGDTPRTSLIVAADQHLTRLLAEPADTASPEEIRDHAIAEATWDLLGDLFRNRDMGH